MAPHPNLLRLAAFLFKLFGKSLLHILRAVVGPTALKLLALAGAGWVAHKAILASEDLRRARRWIERKDAVVRPDLSILAELEEDAALGIVELEESGLDMEVRAVRGKNYRRTGEISRHYFVGRKNYKVYLALVLMKYGHFERTRGTVLSMNSYLVELLTERGWRPTHIADFVPKVIALAMLSMKQETAKIVYQENMPGLIGQIACRMSGVEVKPWKD